MIGVALKGLAARKVRALLTALAVVIGVSMISGTYILTDTMQKAFDGVFESSYAETDAVISGNEELSEYVKKLEAAIDEDDDEIRQDPAESGRMDRITFPADQEDRCLDLPEQLTVRDRDVARDLPDSPRHAGGVHVLPEHEVELAEPRRPCVSLLAHLEDPLDRLVLRMPLEEIRDRVEPLRVAEGKVERRGQQHHDPVEAGRDP